MYVFMYVCAIVVKKKENKIFLYASLSFFNRLAKKF